MLPQAVVVATTEQLSTIQSVQARKNVALKKYYKSLRDRTVV